VSLKNYILINLFVWRIQILDTGNQKSSYKL